MSAAEKAAFVSAVLKLKNSVTSVLKPGKMKRYDDFVQVHKNAMMGPDMFMPMPHGGPLFFPWHRVLLRQFELDLQSAVGNPNLTIPYWDWELSGSNNPFTDDFLGGDGDNAQGHRVVSGQFAYAKHKFKIRVWDTSGNVGLLREFGNDPTAYLPTPSQVASALTKTPYSPGANSWETTCEGGAAQPCASMDRRQYGRRHVPKRPRFLPAPLLPRYALGTMAEATPHKRPLPPGLRRPRL
jgi:tyrosinase